MKKVIMLCFVVLVMIAFWLSCTTAGNPLVGTWKWSSDVYYETIEFESDMHLKVNGYSSIYGSYVHFGTYKLEEGTGCALSETTNNIVTLDYNSTHVNMEYEVSGNQLTLTFMGTPCVYIRQ